MSTIRQIHDCGFPQDKAKLIHGFVGGSSLHGVKLEGSDDTDLFGVYVEHPQWILGIDAHEHFVTSTSPDSERNKPSDVDVTCYSLRKWANLACKGNPTVLQFLFTPALMGELSWSTILGNRELFLAKSHVRQFMGYADAQLKRMVSSENHAKLAMHALRLLLEAKELLTTGFITMPRPIEEREFLLSIRRGERTQEWIIREANQKFTRLKEMESALPASVDRHAVSQLISSIYLDEWRNP